VLTPRAFRLTPTRSRGRMKKKSMKGSIKFGQSAF
jgi:hypothetical protein